MKSIVGTWLLCCALIHVGIAQVDTTYVFSTGMPYGTLDIRIAKSATRYYYLQEGKTFSFRESSPGVKTDTYKDMTSWDSSPYTQGNLREKNGNSDAFIMNYRLLFPVNYNPNLADGYPLIVMTHGAGERGNCWDGGCYWSNTGWRPSTNNPPAPTTATHDLLNNDHNLLHGGQVHLNARNLAGSKLPNDPTLAPRAFPGFVLFPQNLNGWDANTSQDAIKLIRLILKKYKIDQNRIYVHGLSQGGYGTFELIKRAPWLFAAALPMSAVSDAGLTGASYASVLNDMAHIPLWIFQGGIDTNPTPTKTRGYVKRFRNGGIVVRYNEYPHLGHGVWNTAYDEPDFFSWMLSKNKANIHTFGGIAAICRTNNQGVRMELAKGFRAYQWEKDGVIIPDADGPSFVANEPGVYRARFSRVLNPIEQQWNRWSDPVTVTESNPAQAQIKQTGTVILKDLNNYNDVRLSAIGDFAHYYWYKDSVLLDLPGNEDDTTQHPLFKQGSCTNLPACTGNGVYTLVTASLDNCPNPPSEGIQIYFNNQAPVSINAPSTFTGSASSGSEAQLSWVDLSDNEGGFEIWRRKLTGTNTFTKWVMAGLTSADVTSFADSGMEPSSTYQYKLRAVGSVGRSNYTPSATNQFLVITTFEDTVVPSTPQDLQASETGIREITLKWQASSDNTGIRYYEILLDDSTITTPNASTTYKLTNLELNRSYTFSIRAVDLGGNISDESNTATAGTYVTGLYYKHSTGSWSDLDQINWNIAEFTGKVADVVLTPRTQEDYFNFEFNGYLYIVTSGTYQFRTTSDDGSRLTLNDSVIVDNDGLHGNVTVTSVNLNLSAGPQLFNVKYFEATGGQTLTVQYKGPDSNNNWITIPASAYKSGIPPAIPPTATITSPVNNASFIAGSSLTISATASDTDGSISKVEFFQGTTKLGEDTSSPYTFTWSNVPAGSYSLTVKATDNTGATGTSSMITITVTNTPPVVNITSPANNTGFTAPASITINATASDADGSITKVEFFNGTTKLGEDNSSPYSFAWTNVSAGSYQLIAKATDNLGLTSTSAAFAITVTSSNPAISVYPNPATPNSSLTVTGSGMNQQTVRVKLTSLLGETFYDNTFNAGTFMKGVSFTPTKRVYAGIYVLTVQQGSTVIRELILIRN